MIETHGLTKKYGNLVALDDVSIHVPKGKICGVLGPNGAGKTTLFRILCGLTSYEGRFEIRSDRSKQVGAIIEKPKLYGYLNMYDNLRLFSGIQGVKYTEEELNEQLTMVGLPLERRDPVKHFSMGMKQRLGIAVALINTPEVLILDEPFSGLDPLGVRDFRNLIKSLVKTHNHTVLISSHLLGELEHLCDQLVILRDGRIFRAGETQEMLVHEKQWFRITGRNLQAAKSLRLYDKPVENNGVILELSATEARELLRQLLDEGVSIHGFTALDSIERYFESS